MSPEEEAKLRARLLTYPGITTSNVDQHLAAYEEREDQKRLLLSRGMSNTLAEMTLDRQGYPRPPGWRTVFFYPGGAIPRPGGVFLVVAVGAALWWFAKL